MIPTCVASCANPVVSKRQLGSGVTPPHTIGVPPIARVRSMTYSACPPLLKREGAVNAHHVSLAATTSLVQGGPFFKNSAGPATTRNAPGPVMGGGGGASEAQEPSPRTAATGKASAESGGWYSPPPEGGALEALLPPSPARPPSALRPQRRAKVIE